MTACDKLEKLKTLLADTGGLVVGYSGGVDSTFLAAVAHQVLGDKMLAVSARSETYPSREAQEAGRLAEQLGFPHIYIDTSELGIEGYSENPPDRCFYCKSELFGKLIEIAKKEGLNSVADGANADDAHDFRPGMRAAQELGVRSPLKEVGLTKDEIRTLSREMNLPTWNKPAFACLASRFPYGTKITAERLALVEAAEEFLHSQGIHQARVRIHPISAETPPTLQLDSGQASDLPRKGGGDAAQEAGRKTVGRGFQPPPQEKSAYIARIEVNEADLSRFLDETFRQAVVTKLKEIGYLYVALDLQGYRTGSMNEALS